MNPLSPEQQREIVAEACRAPSVHNIQPTRWRFLPGGGLELLRVPDRTLPAADPSGHDVRVSVGAAFEGTGLALGRRGLRLAEPSLPEEAPGEGAILVARSTIEEGGTTDPLARWVGERRAWRGRFAAADARALRFLEALAEPDLRVLTDPAGNAALARAYDAASVHFLSREAYLAELYRWMRFAPSHPDWDRDGLNAACMALGAIEARAASLLLRPVIFRGIQRLGLAGAVVSEGAAIRSAAAVILFCPLRALDPFAVGRRFYRLWLELTAAGLALCPLSAVADHEPSRAALEQRHRVPAERRVANALRVGVAPRAPARSPRLPVEELIV
jgi:nitroreductase